MVRSGCDFRLGERREWGRRVQDEGLIDDLYATIVLRGDYAAILRRLAPIFGSHAGGVLRAEAMGNQVIGNFNLCPAVLEDYNREYYKHDVWALADPKLPSGAAFIGSKIVDPRATVRTAFHYHVLKPLDVFDLLNAKFGDPPGPILYFSFYRPHREVFTERQARAFEDIGRHITRAHKLRVALEREGGQTTMWLDGLRPTKTERRVAELVALGHSNKALCEILGITANTLKWHMRNVFEKAGVRSKAQIIVKSRTAALPPAGDGPHSENGR